MEPYDEIILFRQPERSHLGDCPICYLPHPIVRSKAVMNGCCGKLICESCHRSNKMRQVGPLAQVCPFCRHPLPSSDEEARGLLMKRVEANDADSLVEAGFEHNSKGDFDAAFEYWTKAAELGNAEAHFGLATMYQHGKGVEKNSEKETYHLKKAAIAGHPNARFNLGCTDQAAGRTDRAVKHFIIASNHGHDRSLTMIREFYVGGKVSKEDFAAALRAHQAAVSLQRREAESAVSVTKKAAPTDDKIARENCQTTCN